MPALKFDPPIHPGEILREEFLVPLGLSAGALAKAQAELATAVAQLAAIQKLRKRR